MEETEDDAEFLKPTDTAGDPVPYRPPDFSCGRLR